MSLSFPLAVAYFTLGVVGIVLLAFVILFFGSGLLLFFSGFGNRKKSKWVSSVFRKEDNDQ